MSHIRMHVAWRSYALALGVSAASALLALVLAPVIGAATLPIFVVPVVFSAAYGGFGPGAAAALALSLAAGYLVLPRLSLDNLASPNSSLLALAAFVIVLAVLTGIVASRREALLAAQRNATRAGSLAAFSHHLARACNAAGNAYGHPAAEQAALEAVRHHLSAVLPGGYVLQLLDGDGQWLHTVAIHHPDPGLLDALHEMHASQRQATDGLPARVLNTGEPLRVAAATVEQLRGGIRTRYWPAIERFAGWAWMLAPLCVGNQALGLLCQMRPASSGEFTLAEQAWLHAVADRTASALAAARRLDTEYAARLAAAQEAAYGRLLHELAVRLLEARTPQHAAHVLAACLVSAFSARQGAVALLGMGEPPEANPGVDLIDVGDATAGGGPRLRRVEVGDLGLLAAALSEQRAIWPDAAPREAIPIAHPPGTNGHRKGPAVALPLLSGEHLVGGLKLDLREHSELLPEQRDFLERAVALAARAVDLTGAYQAEAVGRREAEAESARRQRAVALLAALSRALTPGAALDAMMAHILPASGARMAAVCLPTDSGSRFAIMGSAGLRAQALHALQDIVRDDTAPEAAAMRAGQPLWVTGISANTSELAGSAAVYAKCGCDALALLPLLAQERVLGALILGFGYGQPLQPADRSRFLGLAELCAATLDRASQHSAEAAARRAAETVRQRTAFQAQASALLGSTLDLQATLENVTQLTLPRLADFCLAVAVSPTGQPIASAQAQFDPNLEELLQAVQRYLHSHPDQALNAWARLVEGGQVLVVPEISGSMLSALPTDAGLRQAVQALDPHSCLIAPLAADGRHVGVLILALNSSNRRYGPEEIALAEDVSARAASAVNHALRHAEAQSLKTELEQLVSNRTEELQATILKLEAEITQRERTQAQLELSREQLRSLSARLQATREEERARIAREVHDELGQQLTGLKMDIAWLRKKLREQQEPLLRKTRSMAELIDTTVQSVRKITQELRPGILDDFGLLAAIEWQMQEFQKRSGIECHLLSDVEEVRLDPQSATAVFRVFQETLSNVMRHADATRVEVTLEKHGGDLTIQIEDNGRGITEKELTAPGSLGLLGMRERMHLLAGEIDIRGVPNEGTLVVLKIPLTQADSTVEAGASEEG
jgi:signal transduction histidine kinase